MWCSTAQRNTMALLLAMFTWYLSTLQRWSNSRQQIQTCKSAPYDISYVLLQYICKKKKQWNIILETKGYVIWMLKPQSERAPAASVAPQFFLEIRQVLLVPEHSTISVLLEIREFVCTAIQCKILSRKLRRCYCVHLAMNDNISRCRMYTKSFSKLLLKVIRNAIFAWPHTLPVVQWDMRIINLKLGWNKNNLYSVSRCKGRRRHFLTLVQFSAPVCQKMEQRSLSVC